MRASLAIVLPSLAAVVCALLGFMAGKYSVLSSFEERFNEQARANTLGSLLNEDEQRETSLAYLEPGSSLEKMHEFSYSVPNVMTPFLGTGPEPGRHDNAFINSTQFRFNQEVTVPKPDGKVRIFLTGGSTAFGSGAPSQDRTVGAYLESFLNQRLAGPAETTYEVIIAANPGWASTHERILIENRISELQPDIVISLSGANDVFWGIFGRNVLWFRPHRDDFFWRMVNANYSMLGRDPMPDVTATPTKPVPCTLVVDRLARNIALSTYVLNSISAEHIFLLQPILALTRKPLSPREEKWRKKTELTYFRECFGMADKRLLSMSNPGFSFHNLSNVFDAENENEEIFLDSYHFGDRGNKRIAEAIFDMIRPTVRRKATAQSVR